MRLGLLEAGDSFRTRLTNHRGWVVDKSNKKMEAVQVVFEGASVGEFKLLSPRVEVDRVEEG